MKFDMLIVDRFNDLQLVANYLDIPILVKNIERIVDPAILTELGGAPSHSSQLNTVINNLFGVIRYENLDDKQLSFPFRFLNFLTYIIHKAYLIPSTLADLSSVVPPESFDQATTTRYANLTIVQGIEGINPPIAILPSLKYVWPRMKVKYSED